MSRLVLIMLVVLLPLIVFGQAKDRRAVLETQGRIKEISVSPGEKIWLVTATGNIYWTESIYSDWHYGKPLTDTDDSSGLANANLERVSFFNNDTAIITGYISSSKAKLVKGGYYRTTDGGKNWKLLDYGGDSWIYTAESDRKGNAWLGGAHKEVYFSNDFGNTWTSLKMSFQVSDRTYSIHMRTAQNGIAGSENNELLITDNNWKSVRRVPTPLDQSQVAHAEAGYSERRIDKVSMWGEYLVVAQQGKIFYSNAHAIHWQLFDEKLVDFIVDKAAQQLFGVTNSLGVVLFSSPSDYHTLTDKRFISRPIDLQVVNHALFAVCSGYEVNKVTADALMRTVPYTIDRKIPAPSLIKQSGSLLWGVTDNQIYLASDKTRDWYREKSLDFGVSDFRLLDDSTVILWDGIKSNYYYSLRDHVPRHYFPENPIQRFLTAPVESFSIRAGSQGCYHSEENEVAYFNESNSSFVTALLSTRHSQSNESTNFKRRVPYSLLSDALLAINAAPAAVPSLQDFNITARDKKEYARLVDASKKDKASKRFYYAVTTMVDTLKSPVIARVVDQQERTWSTTQNWFTIQLINQHQDTLNVSRSYYTSPLPWNLPWKFEFKGVHFNCYNLQFSQAIKECLPEDFRDKDLFDNRLLLMKIADTLYGSKE